MARERQADAPICGKDPADASALQLRKEAELNAVNNGLAIVPENGNNKRRSLAAAVAEFLDETKLTKKPKTLAAYTTALNTSPSPAISKMLMKSNAKTYSSFLHFCEMKKSKHHTAFTKNLRT